MRIILVRHAEALHNVSEDHSIPDPVLTELGRSQALSIPASYPSLLSNLTSNPSKALILCSPFHRTIETTLLGLSSLLPPILSPPIHFTLLPQLQECGREPCDTGAALEDTIASNVYPTWLNWENCTQGWNSNEGPYEATEEAQLERGNWVRSYLKEVEGRKEGERPDIVVVMSHHGFLRAILKMPKGAVWRNAEAREYKFVEGSSESLLVRLEDAVL